MENFYSLDQTALMSEWTQIISTPSLSQPSWICMLSKSEALTKCIIEDLNISDKKIKKTDIWEEHILTDEETDALGIRSSLYDFIALLVLTNNDVILFGKLKEKHG